MLTKKQLWNLGLPEPSWEPLLTYLWKKKFSQEVLNMMETVPNIRLKTVEVLVHDQTNNYRYVCCQIWRLVSSDTMVWPPPRLTSWTEEHPVEVIKKIRSPAKQDDPYRTYPMKHDLIRPECYSL